MYCKFCGSIISANTKKCATCGAKIDLYDGGQSFYDENELDAWQTDNVFSGGNYTKMPRTEVKNTSNRSGGSYEENFRKYIDKPAPPIAGSSLSRSRRKKKKTFLDHLGLSPSNKLIVLCIAVVLMIVLIVISIVALTIDKGAKPEPSSEPSTEDVTTRKEGFIPTSQTTEQPPTEIVTEAPVQPTPEPTVEEVKEPEKPKTQNGVVGKTPKPSKKTPTPPKKTQAPVKKTEAPKQEAPKPATAPAPKQEAPKPETPPAPSKPKTKDKNENNNNDTPVNAPT